MSTQTPREQIEAGVTEQLLNAFDWVVEDRRRHFAKNPEKRGTLESIDGIIAKYGYMNAGVSAGAGLIPGPFGMAAAVPEIGLVLRNQLAMIYDIGIAYGKKEDVLTKELLAGVFASATGAGTIGLISVHAGKILVKRTSLRVLQKIIAILGGKVTQQVLKSMVAKWVPFLGAAAMATWSKYTTSVLGKHAKEMLKNEIQFEGEELEIDIAVENEVETDSSSDALIRNRILAMGNLMHIDGKVHPAEMEFIAEIINKSGLSEDVSTELMQQVMDSAQNEINWELFTDRPLEVAGLIYDLIALAKRDNHVHDAEIDYLKQVEKLLGWEDIFVEGFLEL